MELVKRIDHFLAKLSGSGDYVPQESVRRTEKIIDYMLGRKRTYPKPITRVERLIEACLIKREGAPFEPANRLEKIIAGWDVVPLTIEQALWKEVTSKLAPIWDIIYGDSPAYTQAIPPLCRSDAKINMIGGKSVAVNQLVNDVANSSSAVYGITRTRLNNETIHYSGTSNTSTSYTGTKVFKMLTGHKYYISATGNGISGCGVRDAYYSGTQTQLLQNVVTANTSIDNNSLALYIPTGTTIDSDVRFNCIDLTQMFGAGNEPSLEECKEIFTADYYPYNTGELVSASSKKLVSEGKNLFDSGIFNSTSAPVTVQEDGRLYLPKGTPLYRISTLDFSQLLPAASIGDTLKLSVTKSDGSRAYIYSMGAGKQIDNGQTFVVTESMYNGKVAIYGDADHDIVLTVQIERGTTATPYTPYIEPIELETNYGVLRSAGNVYDYIDFDRSVIVRRVGVVDLGALNYVTSGDAQKSGQATYKTNSINNLIKRNPTTANENVICNKFTINTSTEDKRNAWNFICAHQNTAYPLAFTVNANDYDRVSAFKSGMQGVMLYYELATPVEEPITIKGNKLPVEAGGTLTFVNDTDYKLPVPNEVEYYVHMDEIENSVNAMYLSDLDEVLKNDI